MFYCVKSGAGVGVLGDTGGFLGVGNLAAG
jgi:hypothetical protein